MNRLCPICSHPIPPLTRSRFCPRCSLQGALELAEDESADAIEIGHVIGDYEIQEELGRGGMGIVYRARQMSLNRLVAVKLLLAGEFADAAARKRFQAEAASAARLRHPNLIAIHEIGEHEGRPFYSMELVEGRTFAELVRDGPLAPATAARLLKTVAETVQFAHDNGVLHRDLKPSNLILDSRGQPRIGDFGLARRLDVSERLTLTGEVLGSPSYLAPEQAQGDRARENHASDIYSLGAILYHLLTGRPPFLGPSPQSILRQVIEDEPLAPRKLNPAVPLDLETICLKCIEKDSQRRYQSAREVAEELSRFLNHEPLLARPVGWAGKAWRWSLRHPARAALLVALAITFLTVAIVPTAAYFRVHRAERAQSAQFREALLNEARALRLGGNSGQRRESWPSLARAADFPDLPPNREFAFRLRCEAIANLALDDAWFHADPQLPNGDGTLLRFDPLQRSYAIGEFHGKVRIVRAADHQPMSTLTLTQKVQHVVDIHPAGEHVALRHRDQIAVWHLSTQELVASEPCGMDQFAFMNGKPQALFLKADQLICVSLSPGQPSWERPAPKSKGRRTLAISGDDRWLAISTEGGVQLQEIETSKTVDLAVNLDVSALRWSRDHSLAIGGADGSVRVWDLDASAPKWTVETHGAFIRALAFSPDNRWLAVAAHDESVRLIDLRNGRQAFALPGRAFRLDFSADSSRVGPIWKSGGAGWIQITNSPVYRAQRIQSHHTNPTLAMSPSGEQCVAASGEELLVFKSDFAAKPERLALAGARAAYFLPDGNLAAITHSGSGTWSADGFEKKQQGVLPADAGGEIASFSRDFETIALANYYNDTVDVVRGREIQRRLSHARVICVALHPNGTNLVSTSLDGGETILWNAQSGEKLKTWPDEGNTRAVFSPSGLWLAQFGPACVLRDSRDWTPRRILADVPFNSEPADAAFSPDGRWLAVVMADTEVHLLELDSFATLARLDAPSTTRLMRLAWSGDGGKLAALSSQGDVQIWDLRQLQANLAPLNIGWPLHDKNL